MMKRRCWKTSAPARRFPERSARRFHYGFEKAYELRQPLDVKEAAAEGLGLASNGRVGPGKDDQEVQVYSFNTLVVSALFDAEGRIVSLKLDEMEVATPNYDGADMPQFSGFPGQGGYNNDENHDGKVEQDSRY